jgi:hypothetical protein
MQRRQHAQQAHLEARVRSLEGTVFWLRLWALLAMIAGVITVVALYLGKLI